MHASRGIAFTLVAWLGLLGPGVAAGEALPGQPPLTVVTAGGAFTRAQMRSVIRPYRDAHGKWVEVRSADGRVPEIQRQVLAENVSWDVVTLNLPEALRACRAGLLEPIDRSTLPPGPDGTPAIRDFYFEGALQDCAVGHSVWAAVVAFGRDAFDRPPTAIADFFDTRRFPGRRGLRRDPIVALEWALLGAGVPRQEVYPLLKTEKGLRRAFKQLDRIRDEIVWWEEGEQGPALIARGEVVMGSAWNGRVHVANQRGARIGILWDGQLWNMDVWAIPRGSDRLSEAMKFIDFATRAEVLARQSSEIPYGPARRSALGLIPPEVQRQLPTDPARQDLGLQIDFVWWAENAERIEARFEEWIARRPVFDFDRPGRE